MLDVTTPPAVEVVCPGIEVAEVDSRALVVGTYVSELRVLDEEIDVPIALDVVSPELKVEESNGRSDDVLLLISETSDDIDNPLLVLGEGYNGGDDVVLVKPPSAVEVWNVNEAESVAVDTPELTTKLEAEDFSDDISELEV